MKVSVYKTLNEINEKYDISFCEITNYDEARSMYDDTVLLYGLGKIDEGDWQKLQLIFQ